jgi:hypothetical protein
VSSALAAERHRRDTDRVIRGGNATIYVTDMDRAVACYTKSLGLQLAFRAGDHWATIRWCRATFARDRARVARSGIGRRRDQATRGEDSRPGWPVPSSLREPAVGRASPLVTTCIQRATRSLCGMAADAEYCMPLILAWNQSWCEVAASVDG